MKDPKVTAIIPTYNRVQTLPRAIESVFAQTYKNLELIVVDDGSTDDTERLVKKLKETCPSSISFEYLKQPQQGVSCARNLAAQKATGSCLGFLDSDDEWFPNKVLQQVHYFNHHPQLPLVHGEEIWIRHGKRVNSKKKHRKSGGMIFQKCLKLCLISPSCAMIKKNIFWELGGFNEEFPVCEDYDLWLRLTSQFEVGYLKEPLIKKYGGHEDQLSQKYRAMDYWRVLSMWNLIESHKMSSPMSSQDYLACLEEIIYKCTILIKGYHKHQNYTHLSEISTICEKATMKKQNLL